MKVRFVDAALDSGNTVQAVYRVDDGEMRRLGDLLHPYRVKDRVRLETWAKSVESGKDAGAIHHIARQLSGGGDIDPTVEAEVTRAWNEYAHACLRI